MDPLKQPVTCFASFLNTPPELTFATPVCSSGQLGSELCSAQEKKEWSVIVQCEPPSSLL